MRKHIVFWTFVLEEGNRYALPSFFKYFFDLRSPIREAFFFTASVLRLSCLAILEVGLLGNSFFSSATCSGFHPPLGVFFFAAFFFFAGFFLLAILCVLSLNGLDTVRLSVPLSRRIQSMRGFLRCQVFLIIFGSKNIKVSHPAGLAVSG